MSGAAWNSVLALGAVLLLAWAAGQWARRRGAAGIGKAWPGGAGTARLAVVAACALDGRRRAVLLRCDGREALVLTGPSGDLFLGWVERP